jgi:hypothetical protein
MPVSFMSRRLEGGLSKAARADTSEAWAARVSARPAREACELYNRTLHTYDIIRALHGIRFA